MTSRRRLIQTGGIALATALSGCSGVLEDDAQPSIEETPGSNGDASPNLSDGIPNDEETSSPEKAIGLTVRNDRDEKAVATITARKIGGALVAETDVAVDPGETVYFEPLLPAGPYTFRVRSRSPPMVAIYEWDSMEGCSTNDLRVRFTDLNTEGDEIVIGPDRRCE